jgi:hypothetical protein
MCRFNQTQPTHRSHGRFIGSFQVMQYAINKKHVGTTTAPLLPQEHTSHSPFDEGEISCP